MVGMLMCQNPLEAGGSVDDGGFVELGVHGGQGGNVDDGAPAHALPDAGPDVDVAEGSGAGHEVVGLSAQGFDDLIDGSRGGGKHGDDDARHDHHGDEVGGVQHRLDEAFVSAGDFVQEKGYQDGDGESRQEGIDGNGEGVADQGPAVVGGEEFLEVFESHPGASGEAQGAFVVFEGDLDAVHGEVAENQHGEKGGQEHQIVLAVLPDGLAQAAELWVGDRFGRSGGLGVHEGVLLWGRRGGGFGLHLSFYTELPKIAIANYCRCQIRRRPGNWGFLREFHIFCRESGAENSQILRGCKMCEGQNSCILRQSVLK